MFIQHNRSRSIRSLTILLLALMWAVYPYGVRADTPHIAVLISEEAAPHTQLVAGFRHYLDQHGLVVTVEEYQLQGQPAKAATAVQALKQADTSLVLSLGSLATQTALKEISDTPVIVGMVSKANSFQHAPNATGVVLEFPLDMQFEWLQRFLPDNKTIGVLFNPKENHDTIQQARQIAQKLGLSLVAQVIETPQDLPYALKDLSERADVLWSIADQTVLSSRTVKPLLLFSYQNRIPLVGLSSAWVKAGALYALDRDYNDLGQQCGEMALAVLHGQPVKTLPPTAPRKALYALNLKIAQHLKVEVAQSLIDGAAHVF